MPLSIGDRVLITGRDHPARGETGTIVEPWDHAKEVIPTDLDWEVEIDHIYGHRCAASSRDLQLITSPGYGKRRKK